MCYGPSGQKASDMTEWLNDCKALYRRAVWEFLFSKTTKHFMSPGLPDTKTSQRHYRTRKLQRNGACE